MAIVSVSSTTQPSSSVEEPTDLDLWASASRATGARLAGCRRRDEGCSRGGAVMIELVRRTFEGDVSVSLAWAHLARVEMWPSWAKHIRSVTLTPPGTLTATSRFPTIPVHYDHLFADVSNRTQ